MSFIRCLSNPEGLYIIDDGNHIEIIGYSKTEKGKRTIVIPRKDWYTLLKEYCRGGSDEFQSGILTLRESVFTKTGPRELWYKPKKEEIIKDGPNIGKLAKPYYFQPGEFKTELEIRERDRKNPTVIRMWDVTWWAIANHERCPLQIGHKPRKR